MLKTVGFPSTRTGDQTIVNGNLVVATAGKGVDFSANANAPGMTSELLKWYEEGTFTATLTPSGSGSITLGSATCYYTRVGRLVTVQGQLAVSAISSPTGYILLGGLPFQSNANSKTAGSIVVFDVVSANVADFMIYMNDSTTSALIVLGDGTTQQLDSADQIKSTSAISFQLSYFA